MIKALLHSVAAPALSVISGILMCAAFPPYDLGGLAWIGLVPLLVAISRASSLRAFGLAFGCGAAFFLGLFDWIRVVPAYSALHHLLLAVYLGGYFAVFGLLSAFIGRRLGKAEALWASPFIWVVLEYLRSHMGFVALPWGLSGHSQHQSLWVLQSAAIAGVYGVSFLIVLVNAAIAGLLCLFTPQSSHLRPAGSLPPSSRAMVMLAATALGFLAVVSIYGRIAVTKPMEGKPIKLVLVQGNIDQTIKWDPKHAPAIMKTYADLTREAARSSPNLIVWPESATPRSIMADRRILEGVQKIAHASKAHLLIGSSSLQKFNVKDAKKTRYANSAFLIGPNPDVRPDQRYDKVRLFPFGEYLPNKQKWPWSILGIPVIDDFMAGSQYTVFSLPGVRFATPICWENLFPEMVRHFAQEGAQLIVNITNEAWFGQTAAPYQFLSMNVFRAVESGLYVVRCANTGISCIIDPCGRVVDRVKDENGKAVFVRGYLTGEVIPLRPNTIYTRYGDWFAWLCVFVAGGFLGTALLRHDRSGVLRSIR